MGCFPRFGVLSDKTLSTWCMDNELDISRPDRPDTAAGRSLVAEASTIPRGERALVGMICGLEDHRYDDSVRGMRGKCDLRGPLRNAGRLRRLEDH